MSYIKNVFTHIAGYVRKLFPQALYWPPRSARTHTLTSKLNVNASLKIFLNEVSSSVGEWP